MRKLKLWWLRIKYRKLMYDCPYRSVSRYCNIRSGECTFKNPWDCPEFLDMEK